MTTQTTTASSSNTPKWKTHRATIVMLLALFPLLNATGCASTSFDLAQLFGRTPAPEGLPAIVEPRVHLGGEALAQKKERMRRVHDDLVHLYRGYEIVERQQKRQAQEQLQGFIQPFIEQHVSKLISEKGEPWNTDLRVLEANLLFAEGALFVVIDEQAALQQVIDTVDDRFGGHESLLIEFPIGETQTLANAIRDLRRAQASL